MTTPSPAPTELISDAFRGTAAEHVVREVRAFLEPRFEDNRALYDVTDPRVPVSCGNCQEASLVLAAALTDVTGRHWRPIFGQTHYAWKEPSGDPIDYEHHWCVITAAADGTADFEAYADVTADQFGHPAVVLVTGAENEFFAPLSGEWLPDQESQADSELGRQWLAEWRARPAAGVPPPGPADAPPAPRPIDLMLIDLIVQMDAQLTGRPEEAARNAMQQWKRLADAVEFVETGEEYYLADGGFSRVVFRRTFEGDLDGQVRGRLTDNSRPLMKQAWQLPGVQALVRRIEAYLDEEVRGAETVQQNIDAMRLEADEEMLAELASAEPDNDGPAP